MLNANRASVLAGFALILACLLALPATAWSAGKIVCWKDRSGKVVGCGDTVPPEYRDSGTRELDTRGVTRKTTESAAEEAKRKAQQQQQAQQSGESKADEARRLADQKRQDTALLATYANAKEIDDKRDRDLADHNAQLAQMRAALKVSVDRLNQAQKAGNKDDIARAEANRSRAEQAVSAKEKEAEAIRQKYADQKARYLELKGGAQTSAAPSAPPAAVKK